MQLSYKDDAQLNYIVINGGGHVKRICKEFEKGNSW